MMRFAAMTFSYEPGSLDDICQRIVQQEIECIDLAAGIKHQVNKYNAARYPREEAAWVRKVLSTYQLDVSEVFLLNLDVPSRRLNPAHQNMYQELFRGFVEFSREIGAESIMMSPGKIDPEIGENASRQQAVETLQFQHDICSSKGLQLNIEPHWHSLAESPESALWFCDQVPGLGLTLDYSHFIAQGYSQEEIEPLHKYTQHIHVRQANRGATNTTISEGIIDFERIFRKFVQDEWEGVICLEYNASLINDAPAEIIQLKKQLTRYLYPEAPTPVNRDRTQQQWHRVVFDPEWCRTCKLCEMVCSINHEGVAQPSLSRINIHFDAFKEAEPIQGTICRQCEDAPCVSACPVEAISQNVTNYSVTIDDEICIGCMACRRACPWDVPKKHPLANIAIKCDLCESRDGGPICVEKCPLSGKALRFVKSAANVQLEVA